MANPTKSAEHHKPTYEQWVLGSMWNGKKVISMDYVSDANELWVLLEDGEEIEIRHVARKHYLPIELLDAEAKDLYVRGSKKQNDQTS